MDGAEVCVTATRFGGMTRACGACFRGLAPTAIVVPALRASRRRQCLTVRVAELPCLGVETWQLGERREKDDVPEMATGRSGVQVAAVRGKGWKPRGGCLSRKHGNRRGCLSCRGFWSWRKERFRDGREPLRRVRDYGSGVAQAMKKVRRPWVLRTQKTEAFGKGDGDVSAARAGTKDSTDATQRVPTSAARCLWGW